MTDFYHLTPEQQEQHLQKLGLDALTRWGIHHATLTLIKMRENAVFRVDTATGERMALRIHRHNYHTDINLNSELQWMEALHAAGIDVPKVIPSKAQQLFEIVQSESVPEPRQVDVFEWVTGAQLGVSGEGLAIDAATLQDAFRTMGELCARLHNHSAAWQLPAGFQRHAWDAHGLTGEQPLWGQFWKLAALTDAERRLINAARAKVHTELLGYDKSADNYSLIHADLTSENIMVRDGRVQIIDLDDAGFGWHLFDIATALYFHRSEPYFQAALDAMIEGYRIARPLPKEILARLPTFFMARGFTYLGWVHTRYETQTARELTPLVVGFACDLAQEYLAE